MFLIGKKARPISVRYPFGKIIPPMITKERLNELVIKLKAGDKSVVDEIVSGNLRLIIYIAGCYAAIRPRKTKDLIGEASLALIQACHSLDKMKSDNFGKYATFLIHRACWRFIYEDQLIPIPLSTQWKYGHKDKKIVPNKEVVGRSIPPLNKMVLDETIQLAIENEDEKQIFELKCAGYNFDEIEEITGWSRSTCHRIFDRIKKRFIRNDS